MRAAPVATTTLVAALLAAVAMTIQMAAARVTPLAGEAAAAVTASVSPASSVSPAPTGTLASATPTPLPLTPPPAGATQIITATVREERSPDGLMQTITEGSSIQIRVGESVCDQVAITPAIIAALSNLETVTLPQLTVAVDAPGCTGVAQRGFSIILANPDGSVRLTLQAVPTFSSGDARVDLVIAAPGRIAGAGPGAPGGGAAAALPATGSATRRSDWRDTALSVALAIVFAGAGAIGIARAFRTRGS